MLEQLRTEDREKFVEIINALVTLGAIVAAILAWVAKIRWAKEYAAAKDETIRAKEAQIEVLRERIAGLKDLTPPKMQEYFKSMREQLEEYNEELKSRLKEASQQIDSLQNEKAELSATVDKLESTVSESEGDSAQPSEAVQLDKLKVELKLARQQSDFTEQQLQTLTDTRDAWTALLETMAKALDRPDLSDWWRPSA